MFSRIAAVLSLGTACLLAYVISQSADACCPAPRPGGKPVVNADQSVIIIWDAANQMQHFIRRASFKSEGDDFGFIVPSPSQPELSESGNEAFPYLQKLTEPEVKTQKRPARGGGCGCDKSAMPMAGITKDAAPKVNLLDQKTVAGFDASVLETKSATALVDWLKENGYANSPEIEAWAKPYIEQGWKFTALKVAKDKDSKESKSVTASALRISFKTERPLFPYREPDYKSAAETLGADSRLLRIYFLAEARYAGAFKDEDAGKGGWTGKVAWAGKLSDDDRNKVLEQLKLPEATGAKEWWLTEFEDSWPYKVAPADVYFSRAANQDAVKREPIIRYVSASYPTDATAYALAAVMIVPPVVIRLRRKWRA